jgi:hypothetical protein
MALQKRGSILVLVLLLGGAGVTSAQWAVEDLGAVAQRAALWIEEALQWAESLSRQAQEIEATYNIIVQQVRHYELMLRDFQRIPDVLNFVEIVTTWGGQLAGLFNQATMMGYNLSNVRAQFTALYENLGTLSTPAEVFTLRERLLSGRMEASQMTVQVTAIQGNLSELYGRICALLAGSITAAGNLEIQQIQAQQNGLLHQQMQAITAIQATHARNTAQHEAEEASMERLRLMATQGAMRDDTPAFTPQGKLPVMRW